MPHLSDTLTGFFLRFVGLTVANSCISSFKGRSGGQSQCPFLGRPSESGEAFLSLLAVVAVIVVVVIAFLLLLLSLQVYTGPPPHSCGHGTDKRSCFLCVRFESDGLLFFQVFLSL